MCSEQVSEFRSFRLWLQDGTCSNRAPVSVGDRQALQGQVYNQLEWKSEPGGSNSKTPPTCPRSRGVNQRG